MLDGNRFILGSFQPGGGFIHDLDPRTKIILALAVMAAALSHISLVFYVLLIVFLLVGLAFCRQPIRRIVSGLKPIFWFIAFTFLFHLIFSGHDDPDKVVRTGSFAVSRTAVQMAVTFSLRIVIFVLAAFMVSLTTSPLALSEAVVSLLKPLRWLRMPVDELGMIIFIAMRFVPVLAEEFETIRKAQIIRGIDFSGSWRRRLKSSLALLLPVFFSALRRADDLSVAIETRGYRTGQPRSSLYPLRFANRDFIVLGGTAMVAAALVFMAVWAV